MSNAHAVASRMSSRRGASPWLALRMARRWKGGVCKQLYRTTGVRTHFACGLRRRANDTLPPRGVFVRLYPRPWQPSARNPPAARSRLALCEATGRRAAATVPAIMVLDLSAAAYHVLYALPSRDVATLCACACVPAAASTAPPACLWMRPRAWRRQGRATIASAAERSRTEQSSGSSLPSGERNKHAPLHQQRRHALIAVVFDKCLPCSIAAASRASQPCRTLHG